MNPLFNADANTIAVSVTSTASTSTALPNVGNTLRCVNEGTSICFISVGTGTQTATLPTGSNTRTCTPVLPGTDVVFSIPNPQPTTGNVPTPLNISAICRAAATTTLMVEVGEGQ